MTDADMKREGETCMESKPTKSMGRRSFLTNSLAMAGFAVVGSRIAPLREGPVLKRTSAGARTTAGASRTLAQYAADGLLVNYVRGQLVGIGDGTITVAGGGNSGATVVGVTSDSEVCSRSNVTSGDTSGCQIGDDIAVGTSFAGDGSRVARWVVANPTLGQFQLGSIDAHSGDMLGSWIHRRTGETVPGASLTVTPYTNFAIPGATGRISLSDLPNLLQVGQVIEFQGCASEPGIPALRAWALYVGFA